MLGRLNAIINEPFELFFQFLKANDPYNAYQFQKVEIYNNYNDAKLGTNPIQVITSFTITNLGEYRYVVSSITTPGIYFDKVFIIPEDGLTQFTSIGSVIVHDTIYDGQIPSAQGVGTLFVYGFYKKNGVPITNGKIRIRTLNPANIKSLNVEVSNESSEVYTDTNGRWIAELIPSTLIDDVQYKFEFINSNLRITDSYDVSVIGATGSFVKFSDLIEEEE